MYLWKTKELVKDLKNGPLTEREQFKYFFVFYVITAALTLIPLCSDAPYEPEDYAISLISLSVWVVITILLYRANVSGDNREFVSRYLSIGLPVGIKVTLLTILVTMGMMFIVAAFSTADEPPIGIWIFMGLFCALVFYWRMYVHINDVSHHAKHVPLESD